MVSRPTSIFLSSAVVDPDTTYAAGGFLTGTMSDDAFCRWVLCSSPSIRNAIVEDVTWWSANQFPFHHQFVVLSVSYTPPNPNAAPSIYNIKLERIGKRGGLFGEAQHRVTIHHAQSLGEFCSKNQLLLGLLSAPLEEQKSTSPRWRWISSMRPSHTSNTPGFVTPLDEKWRGPPATLAHIARIIQHIVASAPQYNISSTNCYYFSRLLLHAIALRHYSFSSVVRPIKSIVQITHFKKQEMDPSTTLIVFAFLETQQNSDGILFNSNAQLLVLLMQWIVATILVATQTRLSLYLAKIALAFRSISLVWHVYIIFSHSASSWNLGLSTFFALIGEVITILAAGVSSKFATIMICIVAGLYLAVILVSAVKLRGLGRLRSQTEHFIDCMGKFAPYPLPKSNLNTLILGRWRCHNDPSEGEARVIRILERSRIPYSHAQGGSCLLAEQYYVNLPRFYDGKRAELPPLV
ncbi:hypothetical protein DL93DRAFT_740136 [Clavulina sp. PMI_390]|nr:hypothetical protein DL93DRAFT_740136 [Clavulina sp. PMI_390]